MEAVTVLLEQFRQASTTEQRRAVADQLHTLLPGLPNDVQQQARQMMRSFIADEMQQSVERLEEATAAYQHRERQGHSPLIGS